eukprot:m51a1_g6515 hypothetical protein (333) ;mRNA; f:264687-266927
MAEVEVCIVEACGWSDGKYMIRITAVASVDELCELSEAPQVVVLADTSLIALAIPEEDATKLGTYVTAHGCCLYALDAVFNKELMPLFGLRQLPEYLDATQCSGVYEALTAEGRAILGDREAFTTSGFNWAETYMGRRWVENGAVPGDLMTDGNVVTLAAAQDGKAALLFYKGAQHRAMWWTSFPESKDEMTNSALIGRSVIYLATTTDQKPPAAEARVPRPIASKGQVQQNRVVRVAVIGSWEWMWKRLNVEGYEDSNGLEISLKYYKSVRDVNVDAIIDVFALTNCSGSEDGRILQELAAKNGAGILGTFSLMLYEGPKYRALWRCSFVH